MDGVWVITMAFTLPLARAQKKLSATRPTSDLLGWHTVSSALGVLVLNFTFTVIALGTLFGSSFFKCRFWNVTSIANVTTIGDNYEAQTLFLVSGYQYISSAIAFNFGYSYRANWFRNWVFVTLVVAYTVIHWTIIIHPGNMSCLWRVNCTNDHILRGITSGPIPVPINNNFNTTVMPLYFRWILIGIIIGNTIATSSWEYFIVNGIGRRFSKSKN
jgi:cation-transporting ATPase 13A3/4/5